MVILGNYKTIFGGLVDPSFNHVEIIPVFAFLDDDLTFSDLPLRHGEDNIF